MRVPRGFSSGKARRPGDSDATFSTGPLLPVCARSTRRPAPSPASPSLSSLSSRSSPAAARRARPPTARWAWTLRRAPTRGPGSVDAPGNPGSVDAPVSSGSIDAPGNPGSVDAPAAANASITLSGDQTGTFSAVAAAGTDTSTGTSLVGIVVPNPPSEFTAIAISVEVSGTLSAKDYATTDFTTAAAEVAAAGNKFYSASIGDNAAGSFGTLHLTSVEPLGQDGTSTVYTVHGSLDASVDAIAGGDPVTLAATF